MRFLRAKKLFFPEAYGESKETFHTRVHLHIPVRDSAGTINLSFFRWNWGFSEVFITMREGPAPYRALSGG